jgi:hypothetical protein
LTDFLTKPLPRPRFTVIREAAGIEPALVLCDLLVVSMFILEDVLDMPFEHISTLFWFHFLPVTLSHVFYIFSYYSYLAWACSSSIMCLRTEYLVIIKCIIRHQNKLILDRYFSISLFLCYCTEKAHSLISLIQHSMIQHFLV